MHNFKQNTPIFLFSQACDNVGNALIVQLKEDTRWWKPEKYIFIYKRHKTCY